MGELVNLVCKKCGRSVGVTRDEMRDWQKCLTCNGYLKEGK